MKIKIFRRSISPKSPLQEIVPTGASFSNAPSSSSTTTIGPTAAAISGGSKKKSRARRTSRNPALCPFSPSVSVSGSEDDEPKPESSNAFLRVARELCSRFTSSAESSQPGSSSSTVATTNAMARRSTTTNSPSENALINTFTEILSNPSLGSPAERAEIACNVIHSTVEYTNILVPDMISITAATYYWGMMDRYEAERLLEGKPEGTFLLRDSAQINYLFSVSFRRYQRTLHARIEHINGIYSFDIHDDAYHRAEKINDLVENYKDPKQCLFYEPQLSLPLKRDFAFDLKHLCRAVITSHTTYENVSTLPLPPTLKKYLREYHFKQPIRVTDHDV
uniref:Suppressor of cytokine signaling 5 n=1 Tax=Panagrolaimus sp. ES5 TaxID=591445 RepID=A0AC34FL19_9BILA